MRTRAQLPVLTMVAAISMVLYACGGGGGSAPVPDMPQSTTMVVQGVPSNHGLSPMDSFTVQPGATVERGNVDVSCPAGGPACVMTVAADGSVQYERTGGTPSVMTASAFLTLPPAHGLSQGSLTVQPGATVERGNVEISCSAGGPACVMTVAEDGTAEYQRTGGMPSVMTVLDSGQQPMAVRLVYGTSNRDSFVHFFAPTRQSELIPTRAEVDRYLRTFDASGQPRRFGSPPVVRFATGTALERREAALRGIHALNAYLPYDRHITVGSDMDGSDVLHGEDVPDGVIFVDLNTPGNVLDRIAGRGHIAGYASNDYSAAVLRAAAIRIGGESISPNAANLYHVFAHELLHAVGFNAHPSIVDFPNSRIRDYDSPEGAQCLLDQTCLPTTNYGLPMIDGEALQALYTDYGSWDSTVTRFEGVFENEIAVRSQNCHLDNPCTEAGEKAGFGVDWRNGLARPWVTGHTSNEHMLVSNSTLAGTVSWTGALVGFTPDKQAVSGDAGLEVNLADLNGSAAFDNLQYRDTGHVWNDGDLAYSVIVNGNYFRSTSGDAGALFGRFVDHTDDFQRGAVGTLERDDLTAAFGVSW